MMMVSQLGLAWLGLSWRSQERYEIPRQRAVITMTAALEGLHRIFGSQVCDALEKVSRAAGFELPVGVPRQPDGC
jgi:hypothetical protein